MQKLVTVTPDQLRDILLAHREWLQSEGKRGARATLTLANLRLQVLSACDLTRANLDRANLTGAEFVKSILAGATLRSADLSNANLESCNLTHANLSRATLRGANLRGACLAKANLTMADLWGADITGALLNETLLAATSLGDCRGLEQCHHAGPSTIDLRTIERSGDLPEKFLLGCGIPVHLAHAFPALMKAAREWPPCLIFHADEDAGSARLLRDGLLSEGIRAWEVPADLHQESLARPVLDPLSGSVVLVLVSRHASERDWLEHISSWARRLERDRREEVLFFIDLDHTRYEAEEQLMDAKDEGINVDEPTFMRRKRSRLFWTPGWGSNELWDLIDRLPTSVRGGEEPNPERSPGRPRDGFKEDG